MYVRRALIAAWNFLILPALKHISELELAVILGVATVIAVRANWGILRWLQSYSSETSPNLKILFLTLFLFSLLFVFIGEIKHLDEFGLRGPSPSIKTFAVALKEVAIQKASKGAVSLSIENTPGSLSLIDRGELSLHTKDPA